MLPVRGKRLRQGIEFGSLLLGLTLSAELHAQPRGSDAKPVAAPEPTPGSAAKLSDEAELARVIGLYEAGRYEQCAQEFSKLLGEHAERPIEHADVKETARVYDAACLIAISRFPEADEAFRAAIHDNPQMKAPDSQVFPRQVVDRFFIVQQNMAAEIQAEEAKKIAQARAEAEAQRRKELEDQARLKQLETLASQEVETVHNRRWIAAVPFGVGQFQNDDQVLGWVFLSSEALLAAAAVTSFGISSHLYAQKVELEKSPNPATGTRETNAGSRPHDWFVAGEITAWAFLGVAAVGVLEAQLSFVPEKRVVKTRTLPPPPAHGLSALRPSVAASPNGASFGLRGEF